MLGPFDFVLGLEDLGLRVASPAASLSVAGFKGRAALSPAAFPATFLRFGTAAGAHAASATGSVGIGSATETVCCRSLLLPFERLTG